jgi:hypothetical protein
VPKVENLDVWALGFQLLVPEIGDRNLNALEMWRALISQHVLHVNYAIYFWISPYLRESWNLKYGTPPKMHKMEIPIVVIVQYKVSGNEI